LDDSSITYGDLIKCLYFADTTEKRGIGAERRPKHKVTILDNSIVVVLFPSTYLLSCTSGLFLAPTLKQNKNMTKNTIVILLKSFDWKKISAFCCVSYKYFFAKSINHPSNVNHA
jgi:hypothetical protein